MITGADRLQGTLIDGKYEIGELLGEGGMAWVYRAVHKGLDRAVAVKIMKGVAGQDDERARRFEREALLASRLHHPHILSTIDFGRTAKGLYYIISEYVPGRMLFDIIREEGRLPLSRVFGLFHQVLAAVEEAHAARVIHRDLKPENILVTDLRSGEDFVKVLDFGIAVMAVDAPAAGPRATVGGITGTPGYMAPEQIRGLPATERSDIYALGVILFELLTGRLPFEDDAPMSLLVKQLEDEPLSLARAAPGRIFTDSIEQVVARAMARDPAQRHALVADLRADLTRAFAQIEPVALACHACTRPIDPLTGLCSLHGSDERVSALPRGRPTEAMPTLPSRPPASLVPSDLAAAIRLAALEEDRPEAAAAAKVAGFLLGSGVCLELTGGPGSGKSAMLDGISRGASRLGMRVLRAGADPRLALTPWYPVRRMVLAALGLDGDADDAETVLEAAKWMGLGGSVGEGLLALFGFAGQARNATGRDLRLAIGRAVREVLTAAAAEGGGICVLADDAHEWDRSSQWLARSLAAGEPVLGVKFVIASERGLLEPGSTPGGTMALALSAAGERSSAAQAPGGMERLPTLAADVLATIAVTGRDVPLSLIEAVHGEDGLLLALGLLERQRMILVAPDRALSIAGPAVAAETLAGLSLDELKARHLAVGRALGPEAGVFAAARHAVEGGDHEQAVELLSRAGEAACALGDEETAGLVHFQRARHLARWELLWGEDEPPLLKISLAQGRALAGSGHRLAAEMVFKEVLANAGRYPDLAEDARKGLELLEAG